MLNKYTAGILAIILGGFGVHRFYLGQRFMGFLRFGAFVLFLMIVAQAGGPAEEVFGIGMGMLFLSAFFEGIIFLLMPKEKFDKKYNPHHSKVTAPASIGDLKAEGVDYFRSGDYDLSIEAFEDALAVSASDPGVHFNLACAHSKTHRLIPALHHLELSVSYGLPNPERIDQHPALDWLRAQPAYATFKQQNFRQTVVIPSAFPTQAAKVEEEKVAGLDLPDISSVPTDDDDLVTRIRKLGKLREQGILTEAEFSEQKEKILLDVGR